MVMRIDDNSSKAFGLLAGRPVGTNPLSVDFCAVHDAILSSVRP